MSEMEGKPYRGLRTHFLLISNFIDMMFEKYKKKKVNKFKRKLWEICQTFFLLWNDFQGEQMNVCRN